MGGIRHSQCEVQVRPGLFYGSKLLYALSVSEMGKVFLRSLPESNFHRRWLA